MSNIDSDIFRLSNYTGDYKPEYYEIEEKIIRILKEYNLSITNAAIMFKNIITTLSETPINNL